MGKGKKKKHDPAAQGGGRAGVQKDVRIAVEAAVNQAVEIQDTASDLPSPEAAAALVTAAEKYREALARLPGHPEAAYNLATCLSEQAELRHEQADQVALLRESRATLEGVIERDTSGRGATTALAHHALGNVIRGMVEIFRQHCPAPCAECPVRCPTAAECLEELRQSCRHLEESVSIEKRLQNPSGGMDEVLVHWGDCEASMMQIVMDGFSVGRDGGGPPPGVVGESLALCSNACSKYSEALGLDTSSGGSDTDTLRLKTGTIVDFLDWALPEFPQPSPSELGFPPETLLATGEQAMGTLLGLEGNNVGGLLAKGDLCRLRARAAMLSGADLQQEGFWREESVRWFSAAVAGAPNDTDALSAAGEGVLEYGRRSMSVYNGVALTSRNGGIQPGVDAEGIRVSAVTRLQEAGQLLSRAASMSTSDTDSPYNAACAYALAGDDNACFHAFSEYCRRLTTAGTPAGQRGGASKREEARRSLREAGSDRDLEHVRGAGWFLQLIRGAEASLLGDGGA